MLQYMYIYIYTCVYLFCSNFYPSFFCESATGAACENIFWPHVLNPAPKKIRWFMVPCPANLPYIYIYVNVYRGFLKWGLPKTIGFSILKWSNFGRCGYPHFRTPRHIYIYIYNDISHRNIYIYIDTKRICTDDYKYWCRRLPEYPAVGSPHET